MEETAVMARKNVEKAAANKVEDDASEVVEETYTFTLDPFAVNDKTVLIGRNGAYEISDAQRKAAEKYMINQLDRALPKTEKPAISKFQEETLKNERERIKLVDKQLKTFHLKE